MIFFVFILILLVVAGVLIVFLRHIMNKQFGSASSQLDLLTQDAIGKLDEAKRKVEEANKYFNDTQAKAKEAGNQARQQLINEGLKEKQDALDQTRKQSEEIMQRAKATSESSAQEMERSVREAASKKAYEVIQTLLPGKMSEETHAEWVKQLLENSLDDLDRMNIPESSNGVELATAFLLKPADKSALQERLKHKLKRAVQLNEKVDPELILGIRLKIGNVVLDGSLKFAIEEALRHVESGHD